MPYRAFFIFDENRKAGTHFALLDSGKIVEYTECHGMDVHSKMGKLEVKLANNDIREFNVNYAYHALQRNPNIKLLGVGIIYKIKGVLQI